MTTRQTSPRLSSRRIFQTTKHVLLLLGIVLGSADCQERAQQENQLVIASYGGAWQEAQSQAMFRPFERATSVRVRDLPYNGQYAKIKEMVSARNVEWDLVDVEGNMLILGSREELLEPIDYSLIPKNELLQGAVHPNGVGIVAWSWVLAYRKGLLSQHQAQDAWRAFFNVKDIPGPRGMRNDPRRTLEIALLADGVPLGRLYPLDVERAFRVLDQFRTDMRKAGFSIVWWDEYAKSPQLLRDSEVVMTPAANGRIVDAKKEGAPIEFVWEQGIVDLDWWIVPKGARHASLAMQFIAFASSPEVQADIARRIPYGPVNIQAMNKLPTDIAASLPTHQTNLQKQIWFDSHWWAENLEQVQTRWNKWRIAG